MSQIERLLAYQEVDSRLMKLEQETANSEERKKLVQYKSFLNKASEKLDQLEGKAKELFSILDRLNKEYSEIAETLKDFEQLDELVEGGADISFYMRSVSSITDKIKALKGEINSLTAAVKEKVEEYKALKNKVITIQKEYPQVQAAYQNLKQSKSAEASKISKELEEIGKDIDKEVLKKYHTKRSERIFPIICEIKGDRCSKCGIELSLAYREMVSSGKVIECENCHRFLFKK